MLHSSLIYLVQENQIKEELEKKIEKLREQCEAQKSEAEKNKVKVEEVRDFIFPRRLYVCNSNKQQICSVCFDCQSFRNAQQTSALYP
jgi:DNA recombination-dependent growth factor C